MLLFSPIVNYAAPLFPKWESIVSNNLKLYNYSLVCVGPDKKPVQIFSQNGLMLSQVSTTYKCAASWENQQSAYAKTKAQISFAVTAKLISAFVFATWIVHFLFFLNPKFQASSCCLL